MLGLLVMLVLKHKDENILGLKVHVHFLISRQRVHKSEKIAVFMCRKSDVIQS
ncbi:hypothetical protein DPMN_193910 [Dreissena polymorpha]|uniref:Uncharacterized protein n=1 Tax=Dreissena polymorpha TaxID=45954 RepID=A0A9D3Y5F7_DREPO|nr:hypothetical protein DPMN_193910 [Dreissena polymorpha]